MKIIEIESVWSLLRCATEIGHGTTAYCFLRPNGRVVKVFYNSDNTLVLFDKDNIINHFSFLNQVSNESFIGPDVLYTINDKVVAYEYDFVNCKTLKRINRGIRISKLMEAFPKLIENTEAVSTMNFWLSDTHHENTLYDAKSNQFYFIDLDFGRDKSKDCQPSSYEDILQHNIGSLLEVIIEQTIGYPNFTFNFNDSNLLRLYKLTIHKDYTLVYEFYNALAEYIGRKDPTIRNIQSVKRMLVTKKEDYHHR